MSVVRAVRLTKTQCIT